MKYFSRLFTFALAVGLVFTSTYFISAQEDTRPHRPQRGDGSRREFDPAQMIQRQVDRAIELLNPSDEEATVLEPRIKAIVQQHIQRRQEMWPVTEALRAAINDNDNATIKSALEALKAKQKEQKARSEALGKDLVQLLTLQQEAQLTILGIVNSDGTFAGFWGFGGRRGRSGHEGVRSGNGQRRGQ